MIEKVVLDYLNKNLSVPVYMEKPDDEPVKYLLIEKTGGSKAEYISFATIAIQSYAESLFWAATLNEEVKRTMEGIITLDEIVSIELARDYNFTDTTKKKYRYQAIFDLVHY